MSTHTGRTVLVTGGGRGIGAAIAAAYARAGARVAVLDADAASAQAHAATLAQDGTAAVGLGCDVAVYADVERACRAAEAALGPVGVLVNNAGISPKHAGRRADLWAMDPAEWHRVVDVNLNGAFHTARALVPGMRERGYGRIVNMSSVAAKAHFDLVAAHYSTTKAALIGFTRHLAGELGPYGITVNALAPGRIDTPLMRTVAPELNAAVVAQTPLRRLGTPEEVAGACLFLTSPAADFITGQVVDVAGGWMMT